MPALLYELGCRLGYGPGQVVVDGRVGDSHPHAPVAHHRVGLLERLDPPVEPLYLLYLPLQLGGLRGPALGLRLGLPLPELVDLRQELLAGGQELVERRVYQPYHDGLPVHYLEHLLEVGLYHVGQLPHVGLPLLLSLGQYHLPQGLEPLGPPEHPLYPQQAYALGAELPGHHSVLRHVCVGPDAELPHLVSPPEQLVKPAAYLRRYRGQLAEVHAAAVAVNCDPVPLLHYLPVYLELPPVVVYPYGLGPHHGGLPYGPGDYSGVRREASP